MATEDVIYFTTPDTPKKSPKPVYEKMSKSRGNGVVVDEVMSGVYELDPKWEFRFVNGDVCDYKAFCVWRDRMNTGCYFTAKRYGQHPVFLCQKDDPVPPQIIFQDKPIFQHEHLLEKEVISFYTFVKKEDE